MENIFCPKCGSKQEGNAFCSNCGNQLSLKKEGRIVNDLEKVAKKAKDTVKSIIDDKDLKNSINKVKDSVSKSFSKEKVNHTIKDDNGKSESESSLNSDSNNSETKKNDDLNFIEKNVRAWDKFITFNYDEKTKYKIPNNSWIIAGFVFAIIGGYVGVAFGANYRYGGYDDKTRKKGLIMLIISLLSILINIISTQ